MDQLTAYKILGLNDDASIDMIKEAYASLSKKYHPEDNPEEFQRIHEAYVTLKKRNRRTNQIVVEYSPLEQKSQDEKEEIDLVFHKVYSCKEDILEDKKQEFAFEESIRKAEEEVEKLRAEQERLRLEKEKKEAEKLRIKQEKLEQEKERLLEEARQEYARKQEEERKKWEDNQYNFDASIHQAEKEEQERLWQLTMKLVEELKVLFTFPNYQELKKFKEFFGRKEYEKLFWDEIFISNLTQCICNVKLKPEIYSYLINIYRLKDKNLKNLVWELQRLYYEIDKRYSIKQDTVSTNKFVVLGGAVGIIIFILIKMIL